VTAMAVYNSMFPTNFERVTFWGAVCAPHSVHVKGVHDPNAAVRRAAEVTIRRIGPCREFATALNSEPNRFQEAHLWNLLGGITCDLAVFESLADIRPLKCYMDALKKCLTSDALHSIMPGHVIRSVRAKVRAASRANMAQPAKRYRRDVWTDADMHVIWQLLNKFPGDICADYDDWWFSHLGLSVTNCADPDPRLVMCSVEHRDQAVLSLRFEMPNLPPPGCNKPMDNNDDTIHPDMYRCAAASGRRQIPASRGVLSFDDPIYKTLPKPVQALARFSTVCNYLTVNNCDGDLWWQVVMAMNGESELELDVMYGVSIQCNASTKHLLSSTRVSTHAIRFFPNAVLCIKFDTTTEESKNRLKSICDRDSYRTNLWLSKAGLSHTLS
jgi:hypothetical protein